MSVLEQGLMQEIFRNFDGYAIAFGCVLCSGLRVRAAGESSPGSLTFHKYLFLLR